MPAKDIFHAAVKNALIKDGWIITADPLTLTWNERDLFVDLGAEKLFTAEKMGRKIAVEVKSFVSASEMQDLHNALGQYQVYRSVLIRTHPDRVLYLAVGSEVFEKLFAADIGSLLIADYSLALIVFDEQKEVILKWLH